MVQVHERLTYRCGNTSALHTHFPSNYLYSPKVQYSVSVTYCHLQYLTRLTCRRDDTEKPPNHWTGNCWEDCREPPPNIYKLHRLHRFSTKSPRQKHTFSHHKHSKRKRSRMSRLALVTSIAHIGVGIGHTARSPTYLPINCNRQYPVLE